MRPTAFFLIGGILADGFHVVGDSTWLVVVGWADKKLDGVTASPSEDHRFGPGFQCLSFFGCLKNEGCYKSRRL